MNNSFPTFPKKLSSNDPCDCDQLFQFGNNKIYIQSNDMIAPYCNQGIFIQDNRGNPAPCLYSAQWFPDEEFDEFGNPLPAIFETVSLQYTTLNSILFGFGDLGPNADLKQWIMGVNSDRAWESPLIGVAPLTNACNPAGTYVNFFNGFPTILEVSFNPFP